MCVCGVRAWAVRYWGLSGRPGGGERAAPWPTTRLRMRALRLTSVGGIQKPPRVLRRRSLLSPVRLAAAAVLPVVAVDSRVSVSARRLRHRRRRRCWLLRVRPRRHTWLRFSSKSPSAFVLLPPRPACVFIFFTVFSLILLGSAKRVYQSRRNRSRVVYTRFSSRKPDRPRSVTNIRSHGCECVVCTCVLVFKKTIVITDTTPERTADGTYLIF